MKMRLFLVALIALLTVSYSRADSWTAPPLKVIASPDGNALLRISPGRSGEKESHAIAAVLKYDATSGGYQKIAEFPLRNPVAPYDAVITNGAQFIVTFDDWAKIGRTKNVVVVYRGTGAFVKAWSLADIFSEEERKKFISSVSSTWWHDGVELLENRTQSSVVIIRPEARMMPQNGSPVLFDIAKLTFEKK